MITTGSRSIIRRERGRVRRFPASRFNYDTRTVIFPSTATLHQEMFIVMPCKHFRLGIDRASRIRRYDGALRSLSRVEGRSAKNQSTKSEKIFYNLYIHRYWHLNVKSSMMKVPKHSRTFLPLALFVFSLPQ